MFPTYLWKKLLWNIQETKKGFVKSWCLGQGRKRKQGKDGGWAADWLWGEQAAGEKGGRVGKQLGWWGLGEFEQRWLVILRPRQLSKRHCVPVSSFNIAAVPHQWLQTSHAAAFSRFWPNSSAGQVYDVTKYSFIWNLLTASLCSVRMTCLYECRPLCLSGVEFIFMNVVEYMLSDNNHLCISFTILDLSSYKEGDVFKTFSITLQKCHTLLD